jgi:2-polyprenyl-3-methyl-5-hydroxy-6-metoxy-1,4-benzoquinol methylase
MTWNWGPCYSRSQDQGWLDNPDVPERDLHYFLQCQHRLVVFAGIQQIVENYFHRVSAFWPQQSSFSVLDLTCGDGTIARGLMEWGKLRGWDLRILSIDKNNRVVETARRKNKNSEIQFEAKEIRDPFFLQAQQFDYVVSVFGLHRENEPGQEQFLKTANRMAKRGFLVVDWLRDCRCYFALNLFHLWGWNADCTREIQKGVCRGLTMTEIKALCRKTLMDLADVHVHWNLCFSISSDRAFLHNPQGSRVPGLAGA